MRAAKFRFQKSQRRRTVKTTQPSEQIERVAALAFAEIEPFIFRQMDIETRFGFRSER